LTDKKIAPRAAAAAADSRARGASGLLARTAFEKVVVAPRTASTAAVASRAQAVLAIPAFRTVTSVPRAASPAAKDSSVSTTFAHLRESALEKKRIAPRARAAAADSCVRAGSTLLARTALHDLVVAPWVASTAAAASRAPALVFAVSATEKVIVARQAA
jgi:hypothetical protein